MDTSCDVDYARQSRSVRRASTCSLYDDATITMDADADVLRDATALHSSARDSWVFRSTIGAYSEDEDDLDDGDNQRWCDGEHSDNNASLSATDDDGDDDLVGRHYRLLQQQQRRQGGGVRSSNQEEDASTAVAECSSVYSEYSLGAAAASETRKPPPKLHSIPGFTNSEALKARLPVRRTALALTPTPHPATASSAKELLPHKLKLKQQQQNERSASRLDLRVDRLALKKRAQHHHHYTFASGGADGDLAALHGKSLEHKIAMHEELTRRDAKVLRDHGDSLLPRVDMPTGGGAAYRMSAQMAYAVAFTSSATLHCALFNFSIELRRLLQLDALPFGVFLLVCWAAVGVLSFAGGWLGDVVRDRVTLLRRAAAVWAFAALLLHLAAFSAGSTLSGVLLTVALPGSCLAHGVLAPNCVVLGAQKFAPANDRRCRPRRRQRRGQRSRDVGESPCLTRKLHDSAPADVAFARKLEHDRLESARVALADTHGDDDDVYCADTEEHVRERQLMAAREMAIHRYFSRCFGASLAGSSGVQLFFFLLVDVDTPALLADPPHHSLVTRRGFLCMLLAAALLLAVLICFAFHSRSHVAVPPRATNALEHKLQFEQQRDTFSWRAVLRVFSRALVGYALLLALLLALVGVCLALVALVVMHDTAFRVRLAAFLMIAFGWYATMSIGRYQLRASGKLSTTCRSLGVPALQLQSALLFVFFVGMSSLSAFLRAQLYTTLVVQVCQTRLDIPGVGALLNPNALGALASVVSLLLIPISNATLRAPRKSARVMTLSPARRLSLGICLYLVGIFLSSVVELYRRTNVSVAAPQPKCGKAHSDFAFLWTAPHVVLLGLSDMIFRVSLQEQLHAIELLTACWPGFLQGAIEFSETVGYVGALALTSALSEWLFRPSTSDLAVVLLLLTTMLAFSYASLKRIAEKIATRQFEDDACERASG